MTDSIPLQKPGGRKKAGTETEKRVEKKSGAKKRGPISRSALLERALAVISEELKQKEDRPTNTIGNLVQLLKLDRSIREEEDRPDAIRIIWDDGRDRNDQSNTTEQSSLGETENGEKRQSED